MIIDGKQVGREILESVRAQGTPARVRAISVAPDAATQSYLRIKRRAAEAAGMELEAVDLPDTATEEDVRAAIAAPGADAIIVQLPLPAHIDTDRVLAAIPVGKDADVLSPEARERELVVPPVAAAVEEALVRGSIAVPGAHAAVIGKGRLVGMPVAERLEALGATVAAYDEHTFTPDALKDADIVVSGAGVPGLVRPDMVKEDAALIDAGTSEQGGAIVGDIDPAAALHARLYTPVPGGIGPITVACLMRNVAQLVKLQKGQI